MDEVVRSVEGSLVGALEGSSQINQRRSERSSSTRWHRYGTSDVAKIDAGCPASLLSPCSVDNQLEDFPSSH